MVLHLIHKIELFVGRAASTIVCFEENIFFLITLDQIYARIGSMCWLQQLMMIKSDVMARLLSFFNVQQVPGAITDIGSAVDVTTSSFRQRQMLLLMLVPRPRSQWLRLATTCSCFLLLTDFNLRQPDALFNYFI